MNWMIIQAIKRHAVIIYDGSYLWRNVQKMKVYYFPCPILGSALWHPCGIRVTDFPYTNIGHLIYERIAIQMFGLKAVNI